MNDKKDNEKDMYICMCFYVTLYINIIYYITLYMYFSLSSLSLLDVNYHVNSFHICIAIMVIDKIKIV